LAMEAGLPCFPYDAPTTAAYRAHAAQRGERLAHAYLSRPPAKRPALAKLRLPFSAFDPDVAVLVRAPNARRDAPAWTPPARALPAPKKTTTLAPAPAVAPSESAAARESDGELSDAEAEPRAKRARTDPPLPPPLPPTLDGPWFLSGEVLVAAAGAAAAQVPLGTDVTHPAVRTAWASDVRQQLARRGVTATAALAWLDAPGWALEDALVRVELTMVGGGSPALFALVYGVDGPSVTARPAPRSRRDRTAVAAPLPIPLPPLKVRVLQCRHARPRPCPLTNGTLPASQACCRPPMRSLVS
jgi:hypothetical protein